ncbi:transcription factor bHLH168-like [Triticum urartu]|uniref:BHLH domain-containing protein n=1 Tax=Triticum urartu TaxID=4572 RepID=A0A8R7ULN7_TRIUA|nr:transcription factor bHLH168-like [Triticum dicoccoides]XP_048532891.1 transcription factor bHLH168-like [Triticum urartu]
MNACALNSMEVKAKPARGGKRSRASGGTTVVLLEKKESEKERRKRMKALCEKLASLIPREHCCSSTDTMTQLGSLDVGASYIKKLKERVDELQRRRSSVQALDTLKGDTSIPTPTTTTTTSSGAGSPEEEKAWEASEPVLQVRQHDDSSMEVRLICCMERPIKLHEVITIHEEEGAEIINANHSVAGHKMFYTIHSRAFSSRIGIDVLRVSERLGALLRLSSHENQAPSCMRSNQVLRYTDGTNATPKELVSNNDVGVTNKVPNPECESWAKQDQVMWSSLLTSISTDLLE